VIVATVVASFSLGDLFEALLALATWVGCESGTLKFGKLGETSGLALLSFAGLEKTCLLLITTSVVESCLEVGEQMASARVGIVRSKELITYTTVNVCIT